MNWRVIVAVVVALVVGAGGGALAEHQRLKNESNKSSSTDKHTTTTTKSGTDLFATVAQRTAACPALSKWYGAVGNATFDSASHLPWATQKVKLVAQHSVIAAAYQYILATVSPGAKAEVEYVIAGEVSLRKALNKAATATDFATAQKTFVTARATKTIDLLIKDAKACKSKA
jgi:hypothetical protein